MKILETERMRYLISYLWLWCPIRNCVKKHMHLISWVNWCSLSLIWASCTYPNDTKCGILKNPKLFGCRTVDYLQAQLTQRSYARDRAPQQIQLVRQRDHRILRSLSKQILLLLASDNCIDLNLFAEDHLDWPPSLCKDSVSWNQAN